MRRNLLGVMAVAVVLSVLGSPANAQFRNFENSFRQIGRELGIGWGDGYHKRPSSPLARHEYQRFTTRQQWPIVPAPPCPSSRFAPQTFNIPQQAQSNWNSWPGQDFGYGYESAPAAADHSTTESAPEPKQPLSDRQFTPADQDDRSSDGSGTRQPISRADEYDQFKKPESPAATNDSSEWIPPGKEDDGPLNAEIDNADDLLDKEVMDDEQYYREIEEMLRGEASEEMMPAANGSSQPDLKDSSSIRRLPRTQNQPTIAKPGIKQAMPNNNVSPVRITPKQPYDDASNVWW